MYGFSSLRRFVVKLVVGLRGYRSDYKLPKALLCRHVGTQLHNERFIQH
jgi:hypothetical protein